MGNCCSSGERGCASRGTAGSKTLNTTRTRRFRTIADQYATLEQVQAALRREGLESSNLIVAIDFTKSNEWNGKGSFGGRSLHAIGDAPNPYEEVCTFIGRTLAAFDDDRLVPCYGFGDARTGDHSVFSFQPDDVPVEGLEQLVWRYRQLAPSVTLAGPTSFAPAIYKACDVVARSDGKYHVLLLVADGQVTRASHLSPNELSDQERDTINAIVHASNYPLSIVMVGVGDGPWDQMRAFDDKLPWRKFDNFQFVNYTDVRRQYGGNVHTLESAFALRALMEVPEQYKLVQTLGLLGRPLAPPPPVKVLSPPGVPMPAAHPAPPMPAPPAPVPYTQPPPGYPTIGPPPAGNTPATPFAPLAQTPFGAPPAYAATYAPAPGALYGPPPGAAPAYAPPQQPASAPPQQYAAYPAPYYPPGSAVAPSAPAPPPRPAGALSGGTSPPDLFLCPITHELMRDPVTCADGHTYERGALEAWLAAHNTSPLTNEVLRSRDLIANHGLRSAIQEYVQKHGAT